MAIVGVADCGGCAGTELADGGTYDDFRLSARGERASVAALTTPNVDGIFTHIDWDKVEQTEGSFTWASIDAALAQAAGAGKLFELD